MRALTSEGKSSSKLFFPPQYQLTSRRAHKMQAKMADKLEKQSSLKSQWTTEETDLLLSLVQIHGKNYRTIATHMPGRNPVQIARRANYMYYKFLDDSDQTKRNLINLLRPHKLGKNSKIWHSQSFVTEGSLSLSGGTMLEHEDGPGANNSST